MWKACAMSEMFLRRRTLLVCVCDDRYQPYQFFNFSVANCFLLFITCCTQLWHGNFSFVKVSFFPLDVHWLLRQNKLNVPPWAVYLTVRGCIAQENDTFSCGDPHAVVILIHSNVEQNVFVLESTFPAIHSICLDACKRVNNIFVSK